MREVLPEPLDAFDMLGRVNFEAPQEPFGSAAFRSRPGMDPQLYLSVTEPPVASASEQLFLMGKL